MAASYPTAPKSFTVKSAGDTIQPAHVNDLQDEVAAIETGLLNGTAPLNSSNSTVANLSVSGNSTIAGSLTVTGSLTLTGQSYVRVWAGSQAEFGTASTGTKLALDQREADVSSEWDSTTYTFTPKSSGTYLITGRSLIISTAIGIVYSQLWVNDTVTAQVTVWEATGQNNAAPAICAVLKLSSGATGSIQWRAVGASTGRMSSGLAGTSLEIVKLF